MTKEDVKKIVVGFGVLLIGVAIIGLIVYAMYHFGLVLTLVLSGCFVVSLIGAVSWQLGDCALFLYRGWKEANRHE